MYSVTDEAGSTGGVAMATGGFEKAKLSRSQLEQRSIIQLKNEQPQMASVQDDKNDSQPIVDRATTENDEIMASTVRTKNIELEGGSLL